MEMDMEMEMDIPLPDELEWLESCGFPYEDEEEPPVEDPHNVSGTNHVVFLPDSPVVVSSPVAEDQTSRKRSCPENIELEDDVVLEKRNKLQGCEKEPEIDEDWLRHSPVKISCEDPAVEEIVVVEEQILSRFASEIQGDCIAVTGPSGDRVYAKLSQVELDGTDSSHTKRIERPSTGLLAQPINVLMERIEQEAFTKACLASTESANDSIQHAIPVVTEQLWVDKYAPKSFTDLLSDEQTNREVLRWLKQWDSRVFPSEKIRKETSDDVLSALRRRSTPSQHQKFFNSKSFFKNHNGTPFNKFQGSKQSNDMVKTEDNTKSLPDLLDKKTTANNHLEEKILLLCGPPGLGKTTLAHVAAKHCGYRAVEINASDDRSTSTVEAKILDVVQMNSVVDHEKPKCLIIDEIDGSLGEGKGAVEVILKMLAAEKKSAAGKGDVTQEAQPGKSSTKKPLKSARLSRPVICICNDLFAPALRQLRQVAKVHIFVQPTASRVVNRLKYICNKEGFKASSLGLTVLAEYTDCDIRSCLNTLQFLHKKNEALNILEVSSQVVGRKDMSKSVYDVWKQVFQKRKVKGKRTSSSSCKSEPNDFDRLHALISNCGDYELTADGIHENFLQLHFHDPMMQKTVKCLNILGTSDSFRQYIMRTQQMSLYVYQPLVAIAVQSLIAQIEKPNIEWPKSFHRYRSTFMIKKDLLKSWHNNISPSISRHLSIESFVEDAISPLLQILSPPNLRPVALHLLSERERDDLNQLVDTMVSYSITYTNVKPEPQYSKQKHEEALDALTLCFDPPITEFVKFKDYHCTHSGLPLAMRQILVHEVEKHKILRESIGRPLHSNDGNNNENQALPIGAATEAFSAINSSTFCAETNTRVFKDVSTQRQWKANASTNSTMGSDKSTETVVPKLKTAANAKKPRAGSSFFDRFRKSNSKDPQDPDNSQHRPATLERDLRPLLFKFNEGFTNAVKRPVRVRELL